MNAYKGPGYDVWIPLFPATSPTVTSKTQQLLIMTGTQKALRIQSPENHNWQLDEVPIPVPEVGEILVKITATALNPVDWKIQKSDNWKTSLKYPAATGFDASGVVEQLGEGVTGFSKGDRV